MPRAAKGDSDKPKGRMSAYLYFLQETREQHKKKGLSVGFGEFTKQAAEQWKAMSDKDKARFNQMASDDKARFDHEMKGFVAAGGQKGGRGSKKAKKDPNAPKRSMSAFFWFCDEERPKVRKAHAEWTVGDVAKELGRRWALVSDADKARYQKQADKDKDRYTKAMAQYKNGGAAKAAPEDDDEEEEEEYEEDDE